MHRERLPKFVCDENDLSASSLNPKLRRCPHCGRAGTLVGHGLVRGYAHDRSRRIVRGRRLLCSNRHRQTGCGRTTAVLLASMLARCVASTTTLAAITRAFMRGARPTVELSKRACARLWRRWHCARQVLRTRLLSLGPPPGTDSDDPKVQLLAHLRLAFGDARCHFEAYQLHFQSHLLAVAASPTR